MTLVRRLVRMLRGVVLYPAVLAVDRRWVQFVTVSRWLALIPGDVGVWVRGGWYARTLESCGSGLYVDWMAAIKTRRTRVGRNVFIGTFSWVGWADIGDDVMFGGHVVLLSGAHHHRFDRLDVPMTEQHGELSCVRIGSDVWVGNGAILMADVASGSVVAAGAVVTKPFAPRAILGGVPARVLAERSPPREPGA